MDGTVIFIGFVVFVLIVVIIVILINNSGDNNNDNNNVIVDSTNFQLDALTIKNSCSFPIWMEGRKTVGPVSGIKTTPFYVGVGQSIQIPAPKAGEASDRFWAKWGCDDTGNNCLMGDQDQKYPDTGCPLGGCTAPIDTLFEPTWGCGLSDLTKCAINPSGKTPGEKLSSTTFFDLSLVDGYTLNAKVSFVNPEDVLKCRVKDPTKDPKSGDTINPPASFATNLDPKNKDDCPLNQRYIREGKVVGCYAPCKKLVLDPGTLNPTAEDLKYVCCTGGIDPADCKSYYKGDIKPNTTQSIQEMAKAYKTRLETKAPFAYSFPYDDNKGSISCDVGVKFMIEFFE